MFKLSARCMLVCAAAVAGCNQPTVFQNPDPQLRHTLSDFRADAQRRFPYKFDTPRVREDQARAQIEYGLNRLDVVNFSGSDWHDVEVWVNRQYVCYVPVMEDRKLKRIDFPMLMDLYGVHFPLDNRKEVVRSVELLKDGQFHEVEFACYDW
jgi:hypothetical protein